jgi:hypothetical protein
MEIKEQLNKLIKERRVLEKVMEKEKKMAAAAFCRRRQGSAYLAVCINGVNRTRYVKKGDEKEWKELSKEWKIFWTAIARWVEIAKEMEKIYRNSGKRRLVEIPAVKKRGQEE